MLDLVRQSVLAPREAAMRLLGIGLPLRVAVEGLVLVAVLNAFVVGALSGGRIEVITLQGDLVLSPLGSALILFVILALSAVATAWAGRTLGGHGTVANALVVVAWLQVVDIAVQAPAILVAALVPPLAPLAGLVALGILVWCLIGFVRALHGVSAGRALGIVILSALGLGFGLVLLVGLLGIGGSTNV